MLINMVQSSSAMSVPEIAEKSVDTNPTSEKNSSTIFLVGSKSVGKSTLLNHFLDKKDDPRETLMLEYSYARKTNQKQGLDKNTSHLWEFGGNLEMLKQVLPSVPIKGKFYYCIMVDLSKVKSVWATLETCLDSLKSIKPDEIVIIGGKYDIFRNYDAEIKKTIGSTLRSLALHGDYNIFYHTREDPTVLKKSKDILHSMAFGVGFPQKDRSVNVNKPLFVPRGLDTWEGIGVGKSSMDEIKARHLSQIPLESEPPFMPAIKPKITSSHSEPVIDSLIAVKYDELKNIAYDFNMTEYF